MHICYISREYPPSLRGGGIASYIKEIATGMAKRGHRVTVICASDDTRKSSDLVEDNVRVIRLSGGDFCIPQKEKKLLWRKLRFIYRFFSYRKKIRECVKSLNTDIIEVPEYGSEGLYLKKYSASVVMRLHTPCLLDHFTFGKKAITWKNFSYYGQSYLELYLMRYFKNVTSCSSSLKEWGVKYANMNPNAIQVIFNPINLEVWDEPEIVSNAKNDIIQILYAGTICDWKGCAELAESGKILEQKLGQKFQLSFVGKSGKWGTCFSEKYKKYKWFNFVGKVSREELMNLYAKADVVIFPSWWENMPMVCIEAMLKGSIVIGSKCGGMSEIIEDGISGFLIEPKSPNLIAEKVLEVLSMTDEKKKQIRSCAIRRIRNCFSSDVILNQMEDYYEHVIVNSRANDDVYNRI